MRVGASPEGDEEAPLGLVYAQRDEENPMSHRREIHRHTRGCAWGSYVYVGARNRFDSFQESRA